MRHVPGTGPYDAKVLVIGEAPGETEDKLGIPFAGSAGHKLNSWWYAEGLHKPNLRLENLYEYRPNAYNDLSQIPLELLQDWVVNLHQRIGLLTSLNIIVPLGNYALRACMRVALDDTRYSITKYRGSIMTYQADDGRRIKMIPSIHPASIYHQKAKKARGQDKTNVGRTEKHCILDWKRIAYESTFPDVFAPVFEHHTIQTGSELNWFEAEYDRLGVDQVITIDIETQPNNHKLSGAVAVVGFTLGDPNVSYTIPLREPRAACQDLVERRFDIIKRVCEGPHGKCLQNGVFDAFKLYVREKIVLNNFVYDTSWEHHALDPVDDHDLAYMKSVFLRGEYHKDECLKGDVDVLTPQGWKRLDQCQETETIAQWEPTEGCITWTKAKLVHQQYEGPLVNLDTRGHHCSYTPNHRLPIEQKRCPFKVWKASEAFGKEFCLPVAGYFNDSRAVVEYSEAFVRLLVAIQADAYLTANVARFNLKKSRKVSRLLELCKTLDVIVEEKRPLADGYTCVALKGEAITEIARVLGVQNNKSFGSWLLEWSHQSLQWFVDEVNYWDGTIPRCGTTKVYFSLHKVNVDWVAIAAALCGFATNVREMQRCWSVVIKPRSYVTTRESSFTLQQYSGDIYCFSTETGFFVARSNNNIFITGNSKHPDQVAKYASHFEAWCDYNGMDCCVQHNLHLELKSRLEKLGRWNYYVEHYGKLGDIWLEMMLRGMKVDRKKRKWRHAKLIRDVILIQNQLATLAGEPLHAKKDLSGVKLKRFLYETLGLPPQRKKGNKGKPGAITTDEVALRKLQLKYPIKCGDSIKLLLEHRSKTKLGTFLENKYVDTDDHIRCEYSPLTEATRLASKENPEGSGTNLQNVSREVRDTFIPDYDDEVFVELDCSQAESRLVYVFTGDPELYKLAVLPPDKFDCHSYNAARIFGVQKEVTKYLAYDADGRFLGYVTYENRYFGKRVEHGCIDGETEVLTRRGFVRVDCLTPWDTEIAQWDAKDSKITFTVPNKYYQYDYDGKMYRFRNGYLAQYVTPNHRIIYESNGVYHVKEAQEASASGKVPLNGYYEGNLTINSALVKVIVATQADATIRSGGLLWNLKKPHKIARLKTLLEEAKISYQENIYGNDGITRITVGKQEALEILYWIPNKVFNSSLLQWNGAALDTLLDELPYWDGEHRGDAILYRTTDIDCWNWVQTISHLRGRKASVSHVEPSKGSFGIKGCEHVSISNIHTSRLGSPHTETYQGKIYCFEVPTSFFVIRRNGCVSITGNSQRGLGGKKMSDELLKELIIRDPEECTRMIEQYHREKPGIRKYFEWINQMLLRNGKLEGSWGGVWDVTYEKKDDDLYRRGYSWLPQYEVGQLLSQWGLRPASEYFKQNPTAGRVKCTVYDSVLSSVRPEYGYDLMCTVHDSLTRQREYKTRTGTNILSMPIEFKIGTNWSMDNGTEFKKLPTRAEYDAAIVKLLGEKGVRQTGGTRLGTGLSSTTNQAAMWNGGV